MVWVGIAWHGTKGDRMGEWDIDKGILHLSRREWMDGWGPEMVYVLLETLKMF